MGLREIEFCPKCGAKLGDHSTSWKDSRQGLIQGWEVVHCGSCGETVALEDNESERVECQECGKIFIHDPDIDTQCPECDSSYYAYLDEVQDRAKLPPTDPTDS